MLMACKCDILRCGGKQFVDVKLLMTHINVEHAKEPRECNFDQCSKHFEDLEVYEDADVQFSELCEEAEAEQVIR